MILQYEQVTDWPPLAWLTLLSEEEEVAYVFHGERVETSDEWFCEAIWAGEFSAGDFDKTDIVAGTGGRIRQNTLQFVSSGSNTDRLNHLRRESATIVSNSLVCLLAWVGGSLRLDYYEYGTDFTKYMYAVLGEHTHAIPTSVGQVKLSYFVQLVWDGGKLVEHEKPYADRHFSDFRSYYDFLKDSMRSVLSNANDKVRNHAYRTVCGLSNGYDSPTIAALAHDIHRIETFSFTKNRQGLDDSGEEIASILGIPCHSVDPDRWRTMDLPEVPFISCSGSVGDLSFKSAEECLQNAVLLSGPSGDTIWDKDTPISSNIAIGDGSMLGFTEYRLWVGFINCPVPSWGVRQIQDVIRISNASEMKPWDVGGNYTRPICRRIVENESVPRSLFGIGKRGMSVVPRFRGDFLSQTSMADFFDWICDKKTQLSNADAILPDPLIARILDKVLGVSANAVWMLEKSVQRRGFRWLVPSVKALNKKLRRPYYHHHYLIHWALDRAKLRYKYNQAD